MLKPRFITPLLAMCLLLPVASAPAAAAAVPVSAAATAAHQQVRLSDTQLSLAKAKDLKG